MGSLSAAIRAKVTRYRYDTGAGEKLSKPDRQRNSLCLLVIAVKSEPVPAAASLACIGSIVAQSSEVVVVVRSQSTLTPRRSRFSASEPKVADGL